MEFEKLLKKVQDEIKDKNVANNLAQEFFNASLELVPVIEDWINGQEIDYNFQGITLEMICNKEKCSYLWALLRMQLLMSNPTLVAEYRQWTPINKDWGR